MKLKIAIEKISIQLIFLLMPLSIALKYLEDSANYFKQKYAIDIHKIETVFHFAAIVGRRSKIDGEPLEIALNLGIDASLFHWICVYRPKRTLYASSSAVYPTTLQCGNHTRSLAESDINFKHFEAPEMT